jgi:hypothetical protein
MTITSGSEAGGRAPRALNVPSRIIEYAKLRRRTAKMGTTGRRRLSERARIEAPAIQSRRANALEPSGR